MTHRNHSTNAGFTLVELMLSMAFIAILLLAIALLVMQISSIYNKGLTLRAVNEAGAVISGDIQRTLNTSNPRVTKHISDDSLNPTGGRLCVGNVVYAWNFGKYLNDSTVLNKDVNGVTDLRLVKFTNSTSTDYCAPQSGVYPVLPANKTALLAAGDSNIALHTFTISDQTVSGDDSQRIYQINMVIGTNEAGVIAGNGCRMPESRIDDEYCAVNEFTFTARAGNR